LFCPRKNRINSLSQQRPFENRLASKRDVAAVSCEREQKEQRKQFVARIVRSFRCLMI
jgi:hypothetical protein